ncbi:MAG: hypothetical protein JXB88_03075 [Spirochaetales bacterium]|nr:hypothetical protein [Spirochaetales bacterium]
MDTYYNFIADKDTLVRFLQILPPLEKDDVWMFILCARDKYLADEEKKKYDLKDTSVVERKIVRYSEIERMMRVLKRFHIQTGGYTDTRCNPLPPECFVLYFTINPKSIMKAVKHFIGRYLDYLFELSGTDKKEEIWEKMKLLDSHIMTDVQSNNSRNKYFIDLDFDTVDKNAGNKYVKEFINTTLKGQSEYYVIETRGGYHILITRKSMSDSARKTFYTKVKECEVAGKKELGDRFEVIVNKQEMIPLPGTLQGGFRVRFDPGNDIS